MRSRASHLRFIKVNEKSCIYGKVLCIECSNEIKVQGAGVENHYISIENRNRITISQVEDVDAFDEQMLWANLKEGGLEITGENLNVEKLDLQEGILIATGKICTVAYNDKGVKKSRMLKFLTKRNEK